MPTAAIGADVMVGFPGETDAEFESTRRMIEELPFTYYLKLRLRGHHEANRWLRAGIEDVVDGGLVGMCCHRLASVS